MISVVMESPAGMPSRMVVSDGPWDSPAVKNRSISSPIICGFDTLATCARYSTIEVYKISRGGLCPVHNSKARAAC